MILRPNTWEAFYSLYRMRQLDVDLLLDFLYSARDADLPANMTTEQREQLERYPEDAYVPRSTAHRHTEKGAVKPNPAILRKIIAELGGSIETTAYVGDSELKDTAMAQEVGTRPGRNKESRARGPRQADAFGRANRTPAIPYSQRACNHAPEGFSACSRLQGIGAVQPLGLP